MKLLVGVGLLIASATASAMAQAKPIEAWECSALFGDSVVVTATVASGRTRGTIHVAGVIHTTRFEVEGFNRRWDWGQKRDGGYRFSFAITPDGTGRYYDFRDETELERAQDVMTCRQAGAANVVRESDVEEHVLMESVVEERPELLTRPKLHYPKLLRDAGVQGRVLVQAIIDTTGRAEPGSVKVIQSPNPGFDQEAKQMVLKALFRPGRMHGRAVPVLVTLPVDFTTKP